MPVPNPRSSCPVVSCIVILTLAGLVTSPAQADSLDTFYLTTSVNYQHDDNLFRLAPGVDPKPLIGKSSGADDITTSSLMFNINKSYSLQRFELQAGIIDYRYRNFDYLNFQAKPYKAAWHWSMTPRLLGNLSTERTQTPVSFADTFGYNRTNSVTQTTTRFNAEYEVGAFWRLLAGVSKNESTNSQPLQGERDWRNNAAEIGVRYIHPSGNGLRYVYRQAHGEYLYRLNPVPDINSDYDEREHAISLNWKPTGKTAIDTRIGWFERSHEQLTFRDYDGLTGAININWAVSGKSSIKAGYARELNSYQTLYSSYYQTDRFTLMPYWQINAKTALRLRYDEAHRDYLDAIVPTSYNGRRDIQRTAMAALEWNPYRDLILSASAQRDTRHSNISGLDYESNMFSLSAQFLF